MTADGPGNVRDLINTLRRRDLDEAASKLSAETGLAYRPSAEGEHVSGVYRQRVTLSSGRFAMIDDGMGFQPVPGEIRYSHQLCRSRGKVGRTYRRGRYCEQGLLGAFQTRRAHACRGLDLS